MIDDLLARCLYRHKNPLKSVRTRWQHRAVSYAAGKTINPERLTKAGLGFLPIKANGYSVEKYGKEAGKNWNTTYGVADWKITSWYKSYGIQVYTGEPSGYLTDLDFEYAIIRDHPQAFLDTLARLCALTENPLLVISKSGGLRFSCRTPEYTHRKKEQKAVATWENHHQEKNLYLEIFGEKGLSRYDARYEIYTGCLLDIPVIDYEAILKIVDDLRSQIGEPRPEKTKLTSKHKKPSKKHNTVSGDAPIKIVDGLPQDIAWHKRKDGSFESVRGDYPCQVTKHTKSHGAAQYYRQTDGHIDAYCHNCRQPWIVKKASTVQRLIDEAPPVEIRETPSFPYFTTEERTVVRDVLGISPDAGWHGQTPVFSTKYEHLYKLTNKFALNGQPSEVEKRRVWSTLFGNCKLCGAVTAKWVDRYLLIAGLYCDGCHKDYHLGSYLELELLRTLENSIVSDYHGFIGNDPEFEDFRLWEPQVLTHLGAGMSTGKSTEIYKAMIALASQEIGKGIIAVPRVSLARFLAHYLRRRDGYGAWGLWHEGVRRADRFIGEYGAIVCLPSLPRAVHAATDDGVEQLHIAIDELDFSYGLLSLSIEQATAVKKCLRDALNTTGLVVSGQTESTLALEAFASELDSENVQGFYNTAKPSEGCVILQKHANIEGKSNAVLAGAIEDIFEFIDAGHNVYAFCSSRRDGDIIAAEFSDLDPVLYNAYTKGDKRADAILKDQKLTDSRLLVATSAAGVGISILDPKARTVIASGLNYGSRDANMIVQMDVRDRGRRGGAIHYTEYELSLPVKPLENETVSLYHEALKIAENKRSHLPEASIKKIARAEALASLADHQIETFISHHLGTVGNMPVRQASALAYEPERIEAISSRRTEIRRDEKEKRITTAINLLKQPYLLTTSEIRVLSNKGKLSSDDRLAHETANAAAQAVGWDDKIHGYDNGEPIKEMPDHENIDVAISLVEKNINTDKLSKQRRGYLAVHFPKWTSHQFHADLEKSDSQLIMDGLGLEITAIHDDRFLGRLLIALLDRLTGKVFDSPSLAKTIREVLQSPLENGKTFGSEIVSGALGASAYRKARFLRSADDFQIVDWGRSFISEWYPARIAKSEDFYALCHAENLDLRLAAISRWLIHQPGVPDSSQVDLPIFDATELKTDLKTEVFQLYIENNMTQKEISQQIGKGLATVNRWLKQLGAHTKKQELKIKVHRLYNKEKLTQQEIANKTGLNQATISRYLNE